ncbi:MAG: hypothetical protein L3J03_08220 [Desulfobacterales bacterium]|nr:hypothetical protein [Desulfobacterales bacterium]
MTMTTTIIMGIGSRAKPFIEPVQNWREGLAEHARPFVATALLQDEGVIVSGRDEKQVCLIDGLRNEMTPGAWQENLAAGRQHKKDVKAWIQAWSQIARQESHVRAAGQAGLKVRAGLTVVLASTTFDPIGSSLVLFFAEIMGQVAREGNLPITVHLFQIAPDAFYQGVTGVPEQLVLKKEEHEPAGIRTARHLLEAQDAFLRPGAGGAAGNRLFHHCWLVSNSTGRGTCLNTFSALTRTTAEFVAFLQHPEFRLPDTAGTLTRGGEAQMLHSLGIFELRLARSSMQQALRSKVTTKALGFLKTWRKLTFDRQKIDSEIRGLINERRLDLPMERFSRNDTGGAIHVPFVFPEREIMEEEEEVVRYADKLKTAWRDYRRANESALYEKTVRQQEQLLEKDSGLIMKKCRELVNTAEGELPAGIAYLSAWLNTESRFIKGGTVSTASGLEEIWALVTEYWDDLLAVRGQRRELKKVRQAIVDKTSLVESLKRQLKTADTICRSESATNAPGNKEQEHGKDSGPNQRRHDLKKDELHARLRETGTDLEKLITREKELQAELRDIDRGLEDPGTRRELFQERVEDKALEDYADVLPQLTESAATCKLTAKAERKAEESARRTFRQWFIIHNCLIVLVAALLTGYFQPDLRVLFRLVTPLTAGAAILNTLVGVRRYFFGARRTWQKARDRRQQAEAEQGQIRNKAVSILAGLEKKRAAFAACFYAIEWYHLLRERLSGYLLRLADGLNGLRKMHGEALSCWENVETLDSGNIIEFPTRVHLEHLWKQEKEAINNILVSMEPERDCFNDIIDLGVGPALEKLDTVLGRITDDRFNGVLALDLAGLLEHLDETVPGFDLEETLRTGIDNAALLVNVHEFARNQGAAETFLVGLRHREGDEATRLLNLVSQDKKMRLVSIEEPDRILFVRLLMKFAPSHWIYFDSMRQNLNAGNSSDYRATAPA